MDRLDQGTAEPLDYQYQRDVLNVTTTGQTAQNAVCHRAQVHKYGIAKFMDYLQWLLIALEMLFLLRFCLMFFGADPNNPFSTFLYSLTGFFLFPFEGTAPLVSNLEFGPSGIHSFEWATLLAVSLYALFFYLVKRILYVTIKPFQPMEGEREQCHASSKGDISLQSGGSISHTESPILFMTDEPKQMSQREVHTDDIIVSITNTREKQACLVNHHIGDYTLIRQLGQGGYASVYLGEHDYLNTRAALKLLDPIQASDEIVKCFLFEAHVLAHLHHPHIVRVLDSGWEEDMPFMVMEYAPEGTLYNYFSPHLPLSVDTILPFVLQIASALQCVHDHKLIHCDVKPENILLGPRKEVWLSDFGTAQSSVARSSKEPSTSELVGTPIYVAPERITGNPHPASDQYSLALMVYQWLCGRGPFQGTVRQVCLQHLETPPPRLRDLVPSISRSVEEVVLKALAKKPQQRFVHVQAFAYALQQASRVESGNAPLKSTM